MASYKEARLKKLKEETEELERAMQGGTEEEVSQGKNEGETSEEPTQSPEANNEGSLSEEAEGTAGQEVAEDLTKETGEAKDEKKDLEYWKDRAIKAEQRFNVSKPKYDSNIYKLKQENIALQQDRVNLKKELNKLKQAVAASKPDSIESAFTKETIDVLGQETVDAIKNALKSQKSEIDKHKEMLVEKEIEQEQHNIKSKIKSDYDTFISELKQLVPDYEEMNENQQFVNYLDGTNSVGKIRLNVLRNAERVLDAERVAQFFLDYKELNKEKTPVDSISKRIAPGNTGSENITNRDPKKKVWTMKEYDQAYSDIQRGVYKGRYDERVKLEAELDAAFIENRIR